MGVRDMSKTKKPVADPFGARQAFADLKLMQKYGIKLDRSSVESWVSLARALAWRHERWYRQYVEQARGPGRRGRPRGRGARAPGVERDFMMIMEVLLALSEGKKIAPTIKGFVGSKHNRPRIGAASLRARLYELLSQPNDPVWGYVDYAVGCQVLPALRAILDL